MSRRRPDHTADMAARGDARRLRSRRRRRRAVRGVLKTVFWVLVLAGTFVLGLGYGKTLSGEDELSTDRVTVTVPRDAVTATLPERTVTVTTPAKRDRPVR
jgi:hypothetical protein